MKITEFDPVAVRCWAWHQAFRKLGFKSEDIYVQFALNGDLPGAPLSVFCTLRTQGLDHSIYIALCPDVEAFKARWVELIDVWNEKGLDEDSCIEAYEEAIMAAGGAHGFVTGLLERGFKLPRFMS